MDKIPVLSANMSCRIRLILIAICVLILRVSMKISINVFLNVETVLFIAVQNNVMTEILMIMMDVINA